MCDYFFVSYTYLWGLSALKVYIYLGCHWHSRKHTSLGALHFLGCHHQPSRKHISLRGVTISWRCSKSDVAVNSQGNLNFPFSILLEAILEGWYSRISPQSSLNFPCSVLFGGHPWGLILKNKFLWFWCFLCTRENIHPWGLLHFLDSVQNLTWQSALKVIWISLAPWGLVLKNNLLGGFGAFFEGFRRSRIFCFVVANDCVVGRSVTRKDLVFLSQPAYKLYQTDS